MVVKVLTVLFAVFALFQLLAAPFLDGLRGLAIHHNRLSPRAVEALSEQLGNRWG